MAAVMAVVATFYAVRSRPFPLPPSVLFVSMLAGRRLRGHARSTAHMQVAFFAGSSFLMQFKDQVGQVTKKDFVPYSERRAAELKLMQERAAALEKEAPSPSSGEQERAPPMSARELVDLLPLQ